MIEYIITEEQLKTLKGVEPFTTTTIRKEIRSRPLSTELQKAGEKATNEFMKAIDWRFNDTEKGKLIIKTIQEIKDNLTHKEYPDADGLQEFPFRSIPRG